jgi:hypothetical protein
VVSARGAEENSPEHSRFVRAGSISACLVILGVVAQWSIAPRPDGAPWGLYEMLGIIGAAIVCLGYGIPAVIGWLVRNLRDE